MLEKFHYLHLKFDADISSKMLDLYLNTLDPQHIHFLQSDIADFEPYRKTLGELTQNVVVVNFDEKGVLTTVHTLDKNDALPVSVIARTTPSPGTEASFMQQLLGNIGRFNPTGAGPTGSQGANGSGLGGAPTP